MSGHTRMRPISQQKVVEIMLSTRQHYSIPIERADELTRLLESLKYIKKLAPINEWVSIEALIAEDVALHTQPGLALKGARHKEGLTQDALAKLLGIRQENLSKMESGKRTISVSMAKRLSKVLSVDYRIFL